MAGIRIPGGDGLRPAGAREGEHPPAVRQRFTRLNMEVSRPILQVKPTLERALVLPLEGKGDRFAVDEVKMRTVLLSRSVPAPHQKTPDN